MANRLANATSPYLLQHAENPVDWWEWGPDAFAEAARRDLPVLLSIGYSACHWCHVMAHESFEDEATAAYLNEHFVCVKVDREERPDVDAVYMSATLAMTGHGGWPMTCALTPDGSPFFAGTYFPDRPRHGMPTFMQVLEALVDAWDTRRDDVTSVATQLVGHLRAAAASGYPADGALYTDGLGTDDLDAAAVTLSTQYDHEAGGFGASPKFPPSMVLEFLMRHADRTGAAASREMVHGTCEAMARGGMYDQIGGGFARYSVDRHWQVPHFEKMLYDNALLLRVYLHWWRQSGAPLARRVAQETADFLLGELRTDQGGFASALDADSDGEEGVFYVWTPSQLDDALGADGPWAAALLGVTAEGTFERGTSTARLPRDPDDWQRWRQVRARLAAARARRVRPDRDDKIVAAWNGLAITALCEAGVLLKEPRFTAAAVEAATLLATVHTTPEGRLLRASRDGVPGRHGGVLEDYGCVAEGYLAVLGLTGDPTWLARAGDLLDHALDRFGDGAGGFFDTPDDGEALVARPRDRADNATPSGTSAVAAALVAYAAITGSGRHRDAAVAAVGSAASVARQSPGFGGWTLATAEAIAAGPLAVAVVGPPGEARDALHQASARLTSPGAVVVAAEPGVATGPALPTDPGTAGVPLLRDRGLVQGKPAAYVCRDFVCELPVTNPAGLHPDRSSPRG